MTYKKNSNKGIRITVKKIKKGYVINVGGRPIKRVLSKLKALEHANSMRKKMRKNPFIQKL